MGLLFSVEVSGQENYPDSNKKTIVIANHQSVLDSFFLFVFLPTPPVITTFKDEQKTIFFRFFLFFAEHKTIELTNPVSIRSLATDLDEGRHILFFPEGNTTDFNSISKIYEGAVLLIRKSEADIVPVAISGLNYCKIGDKRRNRGRLLFPKVLIKILPPSRNHNDDKEDAIKQIKTRLQDAYYEAGFSPHSLFQSLALASKKHSSLGNIIEDITGTELSYRGLLTKVFALATIISKVSSGEGRIGIMLPNTCAAVITFFACHLLGRQTCMLNYTAGSRGINSAIQFAKIEMVISSRRFIENAELEKEAAEITENTQLILLEEAGSLISLSEKLRSLIASFTPLLAANCLYGTVPPSADAVILFTSGSEGDPKAVVLSHSNLLANLSQVKMLIDLRNSDYILNALPFFHCFGLMAGMLLPLLGGTRVFEYPSPLHYRAIPELCYQKQITCLWGTPTFLRGYGMAADPFDMNSLRYVVSGAEKLTEETYNLWNDKFGIRIFQGYGVTEASPVIATNYPTVCKKDTVGQLVSQMKYYLRPIAGIRKGGELVVKGPNIMRGYLSKDYSGNDFVRKPETNDRGAGWYATGDIVEIDEDGFITIVGRIKRFAKIAGEMVSLAAVEELAAKIWPTSQHAVVALPDAKKGEKIVLVTNQENADRQTLLKGARDFQYGDFFVPASVEIVKEIPVLGSGKTNYTELEAALDKT